MNARVLVVDDDPDLRESLACLLEGVGYTVAEAADGFAALGAALVLKPDVVLLDVMMPRENGYRVARKLREAQAVGLLPEAMRIVLVTARKLDHDPEREALFEQFAHPDMVVYKPFDVNSLLSAVAGMQAPVQAAAGTPPVG